MEINRNDTNERIVTFIMKKKKKPAFHLLKLDFTITP